MRRLRGRGEREFVTAGKKRNLQNEVVVEHKLSGLEDPEQLSNKLHDILIGCYAEAARREEGEYLAVVMVLELGMVRRVQVRKWDSFVTPLSKNELFVTVLQGFGPVTGEIEKHAENWAEAVMTGLHDAFDLVGSRLGSGFEDDHFWDDDFDEPEVIAPKGKRRRKGEWH